MTRLTRLYTLIVLIALASIRAMAQQEAGDKEVAFQGTITVPFQNPGEGTLGTLIPRVGYFLSARNFIGIENDDIFAKGYQAAGVNLLYRFYVGKKGSRFQPYLGVAPGFLAQRASVGVDIIVTQASYNAALSQIAAASNLTSAERTSDESFLQAEVSAYQQGCFLPSATSSSCQKVPSPATRNVPTADFLGSGEVGMKYYVGRKFAFEASYRLQYVHQSIPFAQDMYTVTNSTLTPTNYTVNFSGPTHNDGKTPGGLGFKQSANNFLLFGFSYVF